MYPAFKDEQEIPCYSCNLYNECADKRLDCVASRNWYYGGTYKVEDVAKLKRPYKIFK